MRRLRAAGIGKTFVDEALLPDWWDASCAGDASLLPELELRVAQILGLPLALIRDSQAPVHVPEYPRAQLKNLSNVPRADVTPAMHAAVRIAAAAVRNLRTPLPQATIPTDPHVWRRELLGERGFPDLERVVASLWRRGIVVLHVEVLPVPKFQGMVCLVGDRPVVLLGHDQDIPTLLAFPTLHEAGHLANGDCTVDAPVVDATDENDGSDIERQADAFASVVLNGQDAPPGINGATPRELAMAADQLERARRIDAAHILFAWARGQTGNSQAWQLAQTAVRQSLYKRSAGGKAILRRHFDANVDHAQAGEVDRALLRCLFLDSDRNAPAD